MEMLCYKYNIQYGYNGIVVEGLTLSDKWTSDNVFIVELKHEDKLLKGLNLDLEGRWILGSWSVNFLNNMYACVCMYICMYVCIIELVQCPLSNSQSQGCSDTAT